MYSPRSILSVRWQTKITNLKVLGRAKATGTEALVPRCHQEGRGIRKDDYRITSQQLHDELSQGRKKIEEDLANA